MAKVEIEVDAGLAQGGIAAVISKEEGVGGKVTAKVNPEIAAAAQGVAVGGGYALLAPYMSLLLANPLIPLLVGIGAAVVIHQKNKKE